MDEDQLEKLKKLQFDVEHALGLHAFSHCILPAEFIYQNKVLKDYSDIIERCHIYMIGFLPNVEITDIVDKDGQLVTAVSLLGKTYHFGWECPTGMQLRKQGDQYYFESKNGEKFVPSDQQINSRLRETGKMNFNVKYIGQSYGRDGSRNAIDRLLKHETLQKISIQGIPKGFRLYVLLLEIQPANRIFTQYNPLAKESDDDGHERIKAGIDKLHGTSEPERITLYEASLIRYFSPEFNKVFRSSFPSTKLRVLQDCYEKDFSAVIAEICIDKLPFNLCSDAVEPSLYHIVKHDLHKDSERQAFFCVEID